MTPSRFRQLQAFRAVLRSGSVSRAAQRLMLSQPAVTKLLRGLEEETGLALFDRSRRRLLPTPEAAKLEDAVERLFAASDRLDRTIEDMRSVGSGELRIASLPIFGVSLIPRLMARFARTIEPVRISLTVTSSRDVHDLVQAGEVDLGFALAFGDKSTLVAAPSIRLPGMLVLPIGHRLASQAVVSSQAVIPLRDMVPLQATVPLKALEGEPYISLGRQYRMRDLVDDLFERHGIAPRLVAETQSAAAACAMVASGLGFAIVDPLSAQNVSSEVTIHALDPTVVFSINVLAHSSQPLSSMANQFLRIVVAAVDTFRIGSDEATGRS